jgi:hypothetical protein
MRTYIIAGVLVTVCVFAYLGLSRPTEIQKPALIKSEKSADVQEVKTKPSKPVVAEVVQESKSINVEPRPVVQAAAEPRSERGSI